MTTSTIQLIKLRESAWPLPDYAKPGDAGVDLQACIDNQIELFPGKDARLIPTGIAIHISNPSIVGLIVPRSGIGHRRGIILGNSVGIIDSDYQGEVVVSLLNRSNRTYTVNPGDRIAQLLFVPVIQVQFQIVDQFRPSVRSTDGLGSTGNG